jgi:hypothetical protein
MTDLVRNVAGFDVLDIPSEREWRYAMRDYGVRIRRRLGRERGLRRGVLQGDGMKGSMVGAIGATCLVIGFGAGYATRPLLAPETASTSTVAAVAVTGAQPTEEEATAAVRRHRRFTGTSLENATLKLGDCSPGGIGPGVTCMTQIVMDPTKANAAPQNRPIGFARVDGQWEVAVW